MAENCCFVRRHAKVDKQMRQFSVEYSRLFHPAAFNEK